MWKSSFIKSYLIAICFTCFVCATVTQSQGITASSATIVFNHDTVVVNPGQRLMLNCGVKGKYRSCIWEKVGDSQRTQRTFQVEDVHGGVLTGMSKPENTKDNQCGIVINSASPENNGEWICKVFVIANTLKGSKTIVVTVRPQQPTLNINESPLVINENEEKSITCTVPSARPAARIRWFLGTEDVTGSSKSEVIPVDEMGTYKTESLLVYKFMHQHDRRNLQCRVEHPTLDEPEYSEVSLDIRYEPYPMSSLEIYGIPMNSEYEIKYNFTSNPVPEMRWFIEDEEIPVPGESGRYVANIKSLMDNIYMATLKIKDFTASDIGRKYRLHARNDFGERFFDISLSTGPAPPDGDYGTSEYISSPENNDNQQDYIATGTVVAISVIIVFIIILLFIIGIMRYRQMYCFGRKDKIKNHMKDTEDLKEEHDTESSSPTREPNNSKKATNLFKNIRSKFPIPARKGQKEPRLDKLEEGDVKEPTEEKGETNEVVYTEVDVVNGGRKQDSQGIRPESTEYAEIVGTVQDNKIQEQRE